MTLNTTNLFLFNCLCMQISFDGQKAYILASFTLVEAPYLGWHEHQRCIVVKYHEYGQLLYVQFLQPQKLCFTTISTMNRYIYTVDALKII